MDIVQDKVTMRLGVMHLLMALIASIGQRYADYGLHAFLTESGVYADISCTMLLQGKHLSRGIRALRLAMEALTELLFEGLTKWLATANGTEFMSNALRLDVKDLQRSFTYHLSTDLIGTINKKLFSISEAITKFVSKGVHQSQNWTIGLSF